jgi:hypothetical protein
VSNIKVGNRIKIKDRPGWPSPPGYQLANSEGDVISVREEEGFVTIRLGKTSTDIPTGTSLTFRLESIENK